MTRAIIFDCYGVLVTDGWLPFKHEHFGNDIELMDQASYLNMQCDKGLISYPQFITELAILSGVSEVEVGHAIHNNVPNKHLFDLIIELKDKYKIGMLSNAGSNRLFSQEQLDLFDATVMSFEVGYVKPDPRAYQAAADRLGVEPDECIMIDDIERNCSAAEAAGMKSIYYKSYEDFKPQLDSLL
jgi:HAD superfamily hydrolase (TIGR01509 family)